MALVWDEPKRQTNVAKHALDFADARDRFEWETALVEPTHASARGSERFLAIGFLDGALVALVFFPARRRGDRGRLVAAGEPQGKEAL